MKTRIVILLLLLSSYGFSQSGEFEVFPNGLIYSDNSVGKLKRIVDSLNLKFKVCDFNKVFTSVNQAKAHYISLEKGKVFLAKNDIENNISFEDFVKKYPKAEVERSLPINKFKYFDDYDKVNKIEISSVQFRNRDRYSIDKTELEANSFFDSVISGKWYYEYHEKTTYSPERIDAFYFIDNFSSKPIPMKYSKFIQYSECMVDTTAEVFYPQAKESGFRYRDSIPKKYQKFNDYVAKVLKKPNLEIETFRTYAEIDTVVSERPWKKVKRTKKQKLEDEAKNAQAEREFEAFAAKMEKWQALRLSKLDSLKNSDPNFMLMLNDACSESKLIKSSDSEFEDYVSRYLSKEAALELKRNRIVIGGCSMDMSPRIHAFEIALLSAETTKWEIFLRSHLNIMNDRFDRVSDGSYAWEGRKTYIKELEVLDINVLELIIGTCLRVDNPSANHYFGSIGRIGRALSESKDKKQFEDVVLNMIKDGDLDDYNRILMYFLFLNYNYYVEDTILKQANKQKLQEAVAALPQYISSRILSTDE